jgi:hypothetical protein
MFDIDHTILLGAKAELAQRAINPFDPNPTAALQKLHAHMTLIRTSHANCQNRFFAGGSDLKDSVSDVIISQLFLHAAHITKKYSDGKQPDVLVMPKELLTAWFFEWEMRFEMWATAAHINASTLSWRNCNDFLDIWFQLVIERAIPDGRGCERWLKQHLLIPADASTRYDQTFDRTIVVISNT